MQVFWDQIRIDPSPVLDGWNVRRYELTRAALRYGGYSHDYELEGVGPHWYDYSHRHSNVQWDFQPGNYTRYGDVLNLLFHFDDRFVIMATGDEVVAEFDAGAAPLGQRRTYFFHAPGWVKDADQSTAYSQPVEPLPFKTMTAYPYGSDEHYPLTEDNLDYLLNFNTRLIIRPQEPLTTPRDF